MPEKYVFIESYSRKVLDGIRRAYCIRLTNANANGLMIDPSDTCWDVCNTPLPIRNKYLVNTYLLNPIPGKNWIVWIIMPIKPDTFLGVCNMPLPVSDKYLTNMYLLNPISGKDWMVRVEAYCIRPTNSHDYGQMIDPPDTCWGVCNTPLPIRDKYLKNTYLLNPIPDND